MHRAVSISFWVVNSIHYHSTTGLKFDLLGLEAELLPADSCLIHQPAFDVYKNGHAFMIAGLGLFAGGRTGAGAGSGSFGAGLVLD